ncbi:MAG: NADH-quinone oxidoreductase subunit N, partial [Phycisphaerae bacterium]
MNVLTNGMYMVPELVLLLGACVTLIAGADHRSRTSLLVSPLALITLVVAIVASLLLRPEEEFVAPLPGILLNSLSHYTRLITLGIGVAIVLVNWAQCGRAERGEYMGLILLSLMGVMLTASANDLLILFFAIELVSVPTYVLIALSRDDARASEASVKYFFLGALSTAILAYGMSFLYGMAGTTTLSTLQDGVAYSVWPAGSEFGPLALAGLLMVIAGLAFKIAAVPFHVYAPDVYEGAASPVTGMLGFVPKLAGFLAFAKILSLMQWDIPGQLYWVMWLMAAASMTFGNVLALLQRNVKRMLAYSSVAHTGYMLIALLVGPVAGAGPMRDGLAALLFYMVVYGLMNLGAFAMLAAFSRAKGEEIETLDDISGLSSIAPWESFALAVCVFSLIGFPPTAGFLGKLYVFSSAFSLETLHPFHGPVVALAIIGVINSAIGAAYYLKIVGAVYVREAVDAPVSKNSQPIRFALAMCSIPMLVFFLRPAMVTDAARAATTSMRPTLPETKLTVKKEEPTNELAAATVND